MKLQLPIFSFVLLVWSGLHEARAADTWTLEAAIEKALDNNPDARIARHRIGVFESAILQANSSFWPTLQLQSSYNRTDNPIGVFGAALNQQSFDSSLDFNDVPDADNLNVRGVLTVPLYTGGRNTARRRGAQAERRASALDEEATRSELAFQVVKAFHTIGKNAGFVTAAEAAIHSFQINADLARTRVESGTALKTESLDFEVRVAQAREDLIRARSAYRLSLRALSNLLGIDEPDFTIETPRYTPPVPTSIESSDRPEILAAQNRILAAGSEIDAARSTRRPTLSAFGSVDYDEGWEFQGSGHSYTAGLLVSWDLWDGHRSRSKIEEAEYRRDIAAETERKIRLDIAFETDTAKLNLETANERLITTATSVESAIESAALTRNRYEEGLALASQMIDAETALFSAKIRHVEAEADRSIAVAALRKALGIGQLETQVERH